MQHIIVLVIGLLSGFVGAYIYHSNIDEKIGAEVSVSSEPTELTILSTPEQDAMNLPFAEGVQVGDVIYLSGQIGAKPGSLDVVPGGIQAETRQVFDNMKAVLNRHGSSLQRVVKCTVFLRDMTQWPAMNEVYVDVFQGHRPARSALAAAGLALGASVEIECIALVN